jgi:hypothetical protein
MSDLKISQYTASVLKTQKDTDLFDVSEDDGAGGYDSVKQTFANLKDVMAEKIGFGCGSAAAGTTVSMDWNCVAKRIAAYRVIIIMTEGVEGLSNISIKIGSASGGQDILAPYSFTGIVSNGTIIIPLSGAKTEMLSDSDTYFLTLISGGGATAECDVLLEAYQRDV